MRIGTLLLALTLLSSASADTTRPELIWLVQPTHPRPHNLTLPPRHTVGPIIPGLRQGAIPQGLAYWKKQNWFLVSLCFEKDNKGHRRPSVVVALDAATRRMVRCLSLTEPGG